VSDEDNDQPQRPRSPLEMLFQGPTPEQVKEQKKRSLECYKAVVGFARVAVPILKQMQEKARELDAIYSESEKVSGMLGGPMSRNEKVRKHLALMLDTFEGLSKEG